MPSLVRTLIWCCSLAVLVATAEAGEQQSYEPVFSAQAELKKLAKRFEAGLTEISSQKQVTASLLEEAQLALREVKAQKEETDEALRIVLLQKEKTEKALETVTRQKSETETALATIKREKDESSKALAAVNVQKDSILRVLQLMKAQKEETGRVIRQMATQKEATEKALETMQSQIAAMDRVLETVEGQSNKTAKVLESMEAQEVTILELSSRFENQTAKIGEALSALESAGQRFAKELVNLKTQQTSVEESVRTQAADLEEYKANMSEIIGKHAAECQKAVDEQSDRLDTALLRFETWNNGNGTEEATTSQAETATDSSNLETLSSTVVFPPEVNSTVAPPSEAPSTLAPLTALQAYLSSGLAGLTGKPLHIENEHYKGEFLNLAQNPTDRSADVYLDVATLAVSGDKLQESAFQWEFVPVPGEDSSVFYLRNKLNELKPIPSKQDYPGHYNYIRIETVSSGTVAESSQLVITMKATVKNEYYHPRSTPNFDPALNGRDIWRNSSPSRAGTKWILTLAS